MLFALFCPLLSFAGFCLWKKLKIDDWFGCRVVDDEEVFDNEFGEEHVDELFWLWAWCKELNAEDSKDDAKDSRVWSGVEVVTRELLWCWAWVKTLGFFVTRKIDADDVVVGFAKDDGNWTKSWLGPWTCISLAVDCDET